MAEQVKVRFRWLGGLTLTLQILLWVVVAVETLCFGLWVTSLFVFSPTTPYGSIAFGFGIIGAAPYLMAMLVLPVWTAVVAAVRPGRPGDATRLWAWLGYLIPLVCYVAPALVFRSLARETAPKDGQMRVLILAFWSARLITSVFGVGLLVLLLSQVFASNAEQAISILVGILTFCLDAAALLGIGLVRRLSRAVLSHTTSMEQAEVF